MKRTRTSISWIIIGVTLPILATLAWNQFNWLQELRKREDARVQYSMISSAQGLSKRIQEEVLFLPSLLRIRDDRLDTDLDAVIAERYQFWRYYAISPAILTELKLVNGKTGEVFAWDADHFVKTDEVRPLESSGTKDAYQRFADESGDIRITSIVAFGKSAKYTIECAFDKKRLISEVIPALAAESLESTDLYAYRIVDARDDGVVYASLKEDTDGAFARPDIVIPLIQDFKFSGFQPSPPEASRDDGVIASGAFTFAREGITASGAFSSFTFIKERTRIDQSAQGDGFPHQILDYLALQIVNRDGSLRTLSRNATIQNACVSFGVVILLAVLMLVLAEATRRARSLATSQQEFIATITHELKTPLAVISSAAQNLTDGLIKDQAKAEQYGKMIKKESARLGVSIEHFLLYSNTNSISRMRPAQCDVADLVQAALKFTDEERAALEFRTEVIMPESPTLIRGDRVALESVFQNLAQNVIRHAAKGKYLGIIVSVERAASRGKRGKRPTGDLVVVKFRDKGPGIPAREQKLIFEPFTRGRYAVDNQVPGNGIGLNLVKRIITMHGGTIVLESKPDNGSTFIVTLPADKGENDVE